MFSALKILACILSVVTISTDAIYCPPYCRCTVTNSLRHVRCIGQNLISVDLDVPRSVQWLDVSYNSISELSDNIFTDLGLERIMVLDLNHNSISSISFDAFNGLLSIKFIDLSSNHLYRIDPRTFESIPTLDHLKLSSNPLRFIPEHQPFLTSPSLKHLEISHCRLSYFPQHTFDFLPSLEKLNISSNDILIFPENLLDALSNLTDLDITNTAINCDLNARSLLNWAVTKQARLIGSPCSTEKFSENNPNQPKKFEKIVMAPESEQEKFQEIYESKNDCDCISESTTARIEFFTGVPVRDQNRKVSHNDYRGMLWLAFLNGAVTGAALASSAILFWIYCCKRYRCKRSDDIIISMDRYDCVPSETPPPPYAELIVS